MKSQLTVVGLGGSLAKHSTSLAALKITLEGADAQKAEAQVLPTDVQEVKSAYRDRWLG